MLDRPPLLGSLPRATQVNLVVGGPLLAGLVCGFLLSESELGWLIGNGVASLGGIAAGYEHDGARGGATRGTAGGSLFGVGVVLADAITGAGPVAETPEPIALLVLITTLAGAGLGSLGGRLRGRHDRPRPI